MKKTVTTALKIAVSLALYVYIFSKIHIGDLWSILKTADASYLLAAVAVYALIQALSAYRWYLLLRPVDLNAGYSKLLSFYFLGMFFNFLLPTAIGGDVFRVYFLHKETGKLSPSTASVFVDRDLGMAALLLVATVVAAVAGTRFNGVPLAPMFGLVVIAFVAANLAIFYRPTYNLLHKMLALFRLKKADEKVDRLYQSVNSYRGEWGLMSTAIVLSVAVQIGCVVVNVLAAASIGVRTDNGWVDYLVFIPAIGLISMVPLSLNGMGWREVSYLVLFHSVGVSEQGAAALAFLWLGVLVATSLPGGIILILRGRRGERTLPPRDEILAGDDAGQGRAEQLLDLAGQASGEESVPSI
ncbi:MAG TPA: lysylphosphatidylglycerol synthase transmembrane domain-containing protein [Blastocatellia bacterium]|nr:lysylphosphatidylglycerol synthase transmembrane domain-containing protein [Blastocatellia bacterium]